MRKCVNLVSIDATDYAVAAAVFWNLIKLS